MEPVKKIRRTQEENPSPRQTCAINSMVTSGYLARTEYAVNTNPNVIFPQKPAKKMTLAEMQAEAVTRFINT